MRWRMNLSACRELLRRWYERETTKRIIRAKGENCFCSYLHTRLIAGFLARELCAFSFLEAFSCSHSATKHVNMPWIKWEGALNFHLGSLIVKQDPGNTEPIFSLCCFLPSISEGTENEMVAKSGGASSMVSTADHPPTTMVRKRECGAQSSLTLPRMRSCLLLQCWAVGYTLGSWQYTAARDCLV